MGRFRQLLKTTAVRLTLIYTLLFGVLAVGVVAYVSYNTGQLLISQIKSAVDDEVQRLSIITRQGGVRRLIDIIEQRSRQPGANLYLVADATGRIIAGNVRDMDRALLVENGWRSPPFVYYSFDEEVDRPLRALARVFTLPGDLRLLVGRDIGDAERFRGVVTQALVLALTAIVLTGLILWFLVGRRALKHIDSVSHASQRIIAGNLDERLPLSGSGDEFDRLSSSLNHLIARVETLNRGVREMSDNIAHDLKTPLTRLRGRAEAALEGTRARKQSEAFQDIIDEADGLIRTFNALLMISQVESGARPVELDSLAIEPVLQDVFELFEPSAEEAGADLQLEIGTIGSIRGNRELIAQALTNLLDNALKYGCGGDDKVIAVSARKDISHVEISVADRGAGIEEEERERVLGRFVRLDSSRTQRGSGLGLALADAVVKLHAGQLFLEDNNPGLMVRIRLPLDL